MTYKEEEPVNEEELEIGGSVLLRLMRDAAIEGPAPEPAEESQAKKQRIQDFVNAFEVDLVNQNPRAFKFYNSSIKK